MLEVFPNTASPDGISCFQKGRLRSTLGRFFFTLMTLVGMPHAAHALSPAAETTVHDGLRLLYNLDYTGARARIRQLIQQEPNNPYGYLMEASVIWWQSDNEYGLFKDTPTLENLFEADIAQALETGAAALKTASNDREKAEIHFCMGMVLGVKGQWNLLRHRWIKAYFEGRKALKHLRKSLKLDPDSYDAYLGLGIYDYQADRLPKLLKLSSLLMVRGNAKRGLEEMQLAMDRGRITSDQAAGFMITIYIVDEHDYAKALSLIQTLRSRFPESPYFQFLEFTTLYRMGDFDASYKAARPLLDRVRAEPDLIHRKLLSILCGLTGENCLDAESIASSIGWLTLALDKQAYHRRTRTALLHFIRGVAYDLAGDRDHALEDYRQSLKDPIVLDVQTMARHCRQKACTREQILTQLKSMSLLEPGEMLTLPNAPARVKRNAGEGNERD